MDAKITETMNSNLNTVADNLLETIHGSDIPPATNNLSLLLPVVFRHETWKAIVKEDIERRLRTNPEDTIEELTEKELESLFNAESERGLTIELDTKEPTPFEHYFKGFQNLDGWQNLKSACQRLGMEFEAVTIPYDEDTTLLQIGIVIYTNDHTPLMQCGLTRGTTPGQHLN